VLLVIQLLSMNGFFLSIVDFPVCHCVYPCSSLSDPWLAADSLCIGGFLPVIHSWSFVHQSSMFRVVDVLCALSYTVAEDEWIFSSLLWIFFLCVIVYTVQ